MIEERQLIMKILNKEKRKGKRKGSREHIFPSPTEPHSCFLIWSERRKIEDNINHSKDLYIHINLDIFATKPNNL